MPGPTLGADALQELLTRRVVLRCEADGSLVEVSPVIRELLGYEPDDLLGSNAVSLVHPGVREDVRVAAGAALRFAEDFSLQVPLVAQWGEVVRVEARFELIRDGAGVLRELRITLRDATARDRDDELEARWQATFIHSRRGIAIIDPDTRVMHAVNPALAVQHGARVEDLVGMPVEVLWPGREFAHFADMSVPLRELGHVTFASTHRRVDGTSFPAEEEAMSVRDARGRLRFHVLWVTDVTERRAIEAVARGRAAELARSNAELDRFAAVVSHDLQAPLRVVAGFGRLLQRRAAGTLAPDQAAHLDEMVAGTERMATLLQGIREYAQVRSGEDEPELVDAGEVLTGVLAALRADLDAAGAVVRVGRLPIVLAQAAGLHQLFQNLIANAVKFRAAAPPEIEVSAERDGDAWRFRVRDNGRGIEPALAERVFGFGERGGDTAGADGSGIGLAVCKAVVERHGGRIRARPAPGGGTDIVLSLPAG